MAAGLGLLEVMQQAAALPNVVSCCSASVLAKSSNGSRPWFFGCDAADGPSARCRSCPAVIGACEGGQLAAGLRSLGGNAAAAFLPESSPTLPSSVLARGYGSGCRHWASGGDGCDAADGPSARCRSCSAVIGACEGGQQWQQALSLLAEMQQLLFCLSHCLLCLHQCLREGTAVAAGIGPQGGDGLGSCSAECIPASRHQRL